MEQPWQSLDVDDSDLPSLLRPCKRRHTQTTTTTTTNSSPITTTHSAESPPHPSDPQPNFSLLSQTPPTSPQQSHQHPPPRSDPQPPSTTSASPPTIPGPAGLVQAAMLRKAHDRQNPPRDGDGDGGEYQIVPTQEYIRRAVEEGEFEDDFNRNPWLCALEFLGQQGGLEGGNTITPLSTIKGSRNIGRVDLVVAIIKSCEPNGRGDLMVTLKDPTGTIGASIHRKVLEEVQIRKDVSVGSVLILQKVAVFSPSRSACYINITNSNVVKVISKDNAVSLNQDYPVAALKSVLDKECSRETGNARRSTEVEMPQGTSNVTRQHANVTGTAHYKSQSDKENQLPQSSRCSSTSRQEQVQVVEQNASLLSQNATQNILKKANGMEANITNEPVNEAHEGGHTSSGLLNNSSAAKLVETESDQGTQVINGVGTQRQPLKQKSSLLEWTDEQLTQLLALACDDEGSFF